MSRVLGFRGLYTTALSLQYASESHTANSRWNYQSKLIFKAGRSEMNDSHPFCIGCSFQLTYFLKAFPLIDHGMEKKIVNFSDTSDVSPDLIEVLIT